MAIYGFDFALTNNFVTHGANAPILITDTYPVMRLGLSVGFETGGTLDARDRNASLDPRLASLIFVNPLAFSTFRVDLPATGNWGIRLALGDFENANPEYAQVLDTSTVVLTVDGTPATFAHWLDAAGTDRTEATWVASNTQVVQAFATTIFRLRMTDNASKNCFLAHLELESMAAPPPSSGGGAFTQTILRTRWRR